MFSTKMWCVASGDEGASIKIFDLDKRECIACLHDVDTGYKHFLAVTDDNSHIICGCGQKISLYCVETRVQVHVFYSSLTISEIAILHGQQAFISWRQKELWEGDKTNPFLSVWSLAHFLEEPEDASDTVVCKGALN